MPSMDPMGIQGGPRIQIQMDFFPPVNWPKMNGKLFFFDPSKRGVIFTQL